MSIYHVGQAVEQRVIMTMKDNACDIYQLVYTYWGLNHNCAASRKTGDLVLAFNSAEHSHSNYNPSTIFRTVLR